MVDFVKGMRENSWISLKIFTLIIPFLLGMLGAGPHFGFHLGFVCNNPFFFFFPLSNEVDNQVAIRGGCFPSSSFIFQAL